MTKHAKPRDYLHEERGDRRIQEREHDPYRLTGKMPDPALCPECKAVYHKGRWRWMEAPEGAAEHTCAACRRIADHVPAGFLTLGGPFFEAREAEVMHLIHNVEAHQKAEHPLERIMRVEKTGEGREITFTDPHLARGVGEALYHAFQGELHLTYSEENTILRVTWRR